MKLIFNQLNNLKDDFVQGVKLLPIKARVHFYAATCGGGYHKTLEIGRAMNTRLEILEASLKKEPAGLNLAFLRAPTLWGDKEDEPVPKTMEELVGTLERIRAAVAREEGMDIFRRMDYAAESFITWYRAQDKRSLEGLNKAIFDAAAPEFYLGMFTMDMGIGINGYLTPKL